MAKKSSTTALTPEQHAAQDKRYQENHEYDYVIVGTGSSALTVGALLANAGKRVCMLEAHDIPGGYCQSFRTGDFYFCAQVHYIWGCAPGGKIYEFLKRIGLEKDITFELFDTSGYDVMALPDGKKVRIPYGWDKLVENVVEVYPDQKEPMEKFVRVMKKLREEFKHLPDRKLKWWEYLKAFRVPTIIKYRKATVQNLFDECGLSKEAQAVLCANAGDFMEPPERLSLFMYVALFGGYNTGAYYPTKHFKYYIERLAKFITDHEGCHIYYETEVDKINTEGTKVVSVETKNGKMFTAKNYICNGDPKKMASIIGMDKFPKEYQQKLDYEYSPAGVVVYLGLKDIDLREYGFGSSNIWHLEAWDMNKMWKEMGEVNFEQPWIFMSTPTLHTDQPGTTPSPQHQILEIAAYTEYKPFKEAQDRGYAEYAKLKQKIAERMIDIVEEKYIPEIRKHIMVKTVGTSTTNEDFVLTPHGNAYGATMTPEQVTLKRLKAKTPFENFWWCNASSGWAGMYGTVATGIQLYMDLTGDTFYNNHVLRSDEDTIADL
ncbi:NAD(P)/FAD-dependent oxidoreductase [Candidatus Uhrbacteria bacterium CG_4_9_14_3_um_filter_50_9]|uniref:NAD(P)/FAD-dependent oxidoreductase n=1 Tax=Candidatus Uhrbacteria bacterium CG_4_9_14_3_um_filter_50_9 TaxID=1975035 RepID=A0A2M7XD23_9BACT|nr:MAG: NAD(P)/FAD-dependent oxidoreductase [Candidatus Uhrbacteria bacterium CG_4_9_14_3_um_filter_50_9]